jgi:glyoxylase-like metal-dependent hydrolase (beta-lactamase superfamily II)/ferredoxin
MFRMARITERLPANVSGDFYVDSTCIDCATCREMVPEVFEQGDGYSFVHRQPEGGDETRRSLMAVVACPTGSIGTVSKRDARDAAAAFPEPVDGNVFYCGYTSKDSFGAWSYFIRHDAGNVLVDSPRAAAPLLRRIGELGGVRLMLLTHRDDVADHAQFRKHFGCDRVIHHDDAGALGGAGEVFLEGSEAAQLDADLVAIPTPGHTRGHVVYLFRKTFLFTGDHLAWSKTRGHLVGFRDVNWYSWPEQIRSMKRLLDYDFTWVLPGHGDRFRTPSSTAMRRELERCITWMKGR